HHQTAQRWVERALAFGPMAALDDRPRPGKEPTITVEARPWVVDLVCCKAKEPGYPHELWTTTTSHPSCGSTGPAEGHACLAELAQGTLCNILRRTEPPSSSARIQTRTQGPHHRRHGRIQSPSRRLYL